MEGRVLGNDRRMAEHLTDLGAPLLGRTHMAALLAFTHSAAQGVHLAEDFHPTAVGLQPVSAQLVVGRLFLQLQDGVAGDLVARIQGWLARHHAASPRSLIIR